MKLTLLGVLLLALPVVAMLRSIFTTGIVAFSVKDFPASLRGQLRAAISRQASTVTGKRVAAI
ncbi:MAG TPA: hypothetical protein VMB73_11815 [Acetobacteraceae bacterium]|jgi:hypothetical protein|nr:hypothetical protein [Acetobacteraceae bacterium]